MFPDKSTQLKQKHAMESLVIVKFLNQNAGISKFEQVLVATPLPVVAKGSELLRERRISRESPDQETRLHTAGGHQLATCPAAKGGLAT